MLISNYFTHIMWTTQLKTFKGISTDSGVDFKSVSESKLQEDGNTGMKYEVKCPGEEVNLFFWNAKERRERE